MPCELYLKAANIPRASQLCSTQCTSCGTPKYRTGCTVSSVLLRCTPHYPRTARHGVRLCIVRSAVNDQTSRNFVKRQVNYTWIGAALLHGKL